MEPKRAPSWKSTPKSLRVSYSFDSLHRAMSVSRMTMDPLSGLSRPISDFRKTDLPVPDGPSSTETSPGGRVSVTSFQMVCRPKDLVSSWTATSTPTGRSLLTNDANRLHAVRHCDGRHHAQRLGNSLVTSAARESMTKPGAALPVRPEPRQDCDILSRTP